MRKGPALSGISKRRMLRWYIRGLQRDVCGDLVGVDVASNDQANTKPLRWTLLGVDDRP